MTAQEAYDKTEKLIQAYANGDLLGGNPMQYIEQYAIQSAEERLMQAKKYLGGCCFSGFPRDVQLAKVLDIAAGLTTEK